MPFVEIKTNLNLSENVKEELSKELGKKINIIGKTEYWLMVNIIDKQNMYFQGSDEPCAICEVKLYGEADSREANMFTGSITSSIIDLTGIKPGRIYVNYFGTDNWGFSGNNF